ncbi:unnamed protein product [Bemisia tabaci]|uniref:Uncharacterized protein n=1 Tax=Bemisia tabaci TaxID=7038 RepID=A0A9P0F799_BEMTA|nr:unnamed protein product [Bemisia tabaci]
MSDSEDKSVNQVPVTKKGQSSKRQGKSSKQAHQDKFRAKKNEAFLNKKMKQLDKSLYFTPDVDKIFNSLQISTVSKATELPVTSRGIGLLTLESFKKAQYLKMPPMNVTIFSVYRASLAQFGAKVIMCRRFKSTPLHSRPQMDLTFEEQNLSLILGQQQNFSCIATAINQLGTVQVGDIKYVVEMPANALPMLVDNRQCRPAIANVDGRPQPVCNPQGDIERAGFGPNPYLVTLSNLRATVVLLADPATPQASRQYFYENNPLPGSTWNVGPQGPVLTNPDVIYIYYILLYI